MVLVGSGRFEGMTTQISYMALLLVFSLCKPSVDSAGFFAGIALLCFAGITLQQYLGENPLGLYPRGRSIYTNYEFQSTTGNIDMGGGYLTLVSALLLAYYVTKGGELGSILLIPGLLGVLLILATCVQAGYMAIYGGVMLLFVVMMCCPAMRSRGFVLAGLLMAVLTLRSLIGLPWVDGLKAPWNLPQRPDAILPQLQGGEPLVFPWAPSVKKFLPLIGTAVCMGLAILTKKHPGLAFKKWIPWTVLACGLAGYLIAVKLIDIPWTAGSLWELHEILNGRALSDFGSERWGVWTHTLHIAKDHLLFGTGPDTFRYAIHNHLLAEGAKLKQTFDTPHNMFLAVLAQNGIPGLLLYVGTIVTAVWNGARNKESWPLIAAVVCYLIQGFFSFSIVIVTPMFWAVLGMLIACNDKQTERKEYR